MSKNYIGKKRKSFGSGILIVCFAAFALTFIISYSVNTNKESQKKSMAKTEKNISQQLDEIFSEQKEEKKQEEKPEENVTPPAVKKEKINIQKEEKAASQIAEETNAELYSEDENVVASAPASKAVVPIENGRIEKEFSTKPEYSDFYEDWRQHSGIDIAGSPGEAVRAVADGVVAESYIDPINGGTMKIEHNGFISVYMGLKPEDMEMNGTVVKQGDTIGTLEGNILGESAGTHLHFEIIENGAAIDPMKYIG